jgi:hypothetical protein
MEVGPFTNPNVHRCPHISLNRSLHWHSWGHRMEEIIKFINDCEGRFKVNRKLNKGVLVRCSLTPGFLSYSFWFWALGIGSYQAALFHLITHDRSIKYFFASYKMIRFISRIRFIRRLYFICWIYMLFLFFEAKADLPQESTSTGDLSLILRLLPHGTKNNNTVYNATSTGRVQWKMQAQFGEGFFLL